MTSEEHVDHPTEALSAHLDGELTPAEREAVEQHLAACADCAALFADLQRLHQAVAGEEIPAVPADLAARITRRLGVEGAGGMPLPKHRRRLPAGPLALAASLIAAAILYVAWQEHPVEVVPVAVDAPPGPHVPAAPPALERDAPTRAEPTDMAPRSPKPARAEAATRQGSQARKMSDSIVAPGPSQEASEQLTAKATRGTFAASESDLTHSADTVRESARPAPASAGSVGGAVEGGVEGGVAGGFVGGVVGGVLGGVPGGGTLARAPGRSLRLDGGSYQMTLTDSGTLKMTSGAYECTVDLSRARELASAPNAPGDGAIADLFRRAEEGLRPRAGAARRNRSGPSVFLVAPDSSEALVAPKTKLVEAIRSLALEHHGGLVRDTCGQLPESISGESIRH